jgi:hypothetical protein
MRLTREGSQTLQYLRGVFGFEQVDGQEAIMRLHVERWHLAGLQEVADVFHLDKGHLALLEPDSRRWQGLVGQFTQRSSIFESVQEIARW